MVSPASAAPRSSPKEMALAGRVRSRFSMVISRVPHTDSILDLLREEGVRATFFVVGKAVERHPALARRMLAEGHELGNHSYSHRPLVLVSPRTIRREPCPSS